MILSVTGAHPHFGPALIVKFQGVANQVLQHLQQLDTVSGDLRQLPDDYNGVFSS